MTTTNGDGSRPQRGQGGSGNPSGATSTHKGAPLHAGQCDRRARAACSTRATRARRIIVPLYVVRVDAVVNLDGLTAESRARRRVRMPRAVVVIAEPNVSRARDPKHAWRPTARRAHPRAVGGVDDWLPRAFESARGAMRAAMAVYVSAEPVQASRV